MKIGSISSGTIRQEDLIPCFIAEIESHRPMKRSHRTRVCEIKRDLDKKNYYETEQADYDLESLFDILNELSLPYFYFGAHPGDGSDYGWWLQDDWQQQAEDDGAITKEVYESEGKASGYTGLVVDISDHGNVSLLFKARRQPLKAVWSIV